MWLPRNCRRWKQASPGFWPSKGNAQQDLFPSGYFTTLFSIRACWITTGCLGL